MALSGNAFPRLQLQWTGTALETDTGKLKAQVADGREVDLTEDTISLNLIFASCWGDMWITLPKLPLMVLRGSSRAVILGAATIRENLGIDVMRQLKKPWNDFRAETWRPLGNEGAG